MKMWPVLFVLIAAGACGAQVVGDAAKRRSDPDAVRVGLVNPAEGNGGMLLVPGGLLRQRYELVATLSTRNYCLAIQAEGEPATLVDQFEIHWCSTPGERSSSQSGSQRPALAKIQVSTQLLHKGPAAPRGTC